MSSVGADTLQMLKQGGAESVVLDCRLAYAEAAQLLNHYLKPLEGARRCFPTMLPTQASGRWSTKNPPLVNVPVEYRNVVMPDPGEYWISFDFDAIEAKLATALSGDMEDLGVFERNEDIHTLTCCQVFGYTLPPVLTKSLHTALECEGWRTQVHWEGVDDRRRHLAKTLRYALAYGSDETSVLHARDVEKLGLTRKQLLDAGKAYLRAKPRLVAWKRRVWGEALRNRETRTFLGRRRRLFPSAQEIDLYNKSGRPGNAAREGLNHTIQGGVADVLNLTIKGVVDWWPEATLVLNAHDSATFAFPVGYMVWPEIRGLVERSWEISPGVSVTFSAEWKRVNDHGEKEKL